MLKRYIDAGMAFTQMTRDRAEAIVKELVKAGDVQREQAHERVEELVDRGRKSSDALFEMVRKEIAKQLTGMGLVTRADLAEFEARLKAEVATPASKAPPKKVVKTGPKPAAKTTSKPKPKAPPSGATSPGSAKPEAKKPASG